MSDIEEKWNDIKFHQDELLRLWLWGLLWGFVFGLLLGWRIWA